MLKFSIIIPTCNRNKQLKICIERLIPGLQNFNADLYEVIVADDRPSELSRQSIENNFPWVKYLDGPGKGPAANRNFGALHAKGEWLVFLDDDVIPDINILSAYNEAILVYENKYLVLEGKTSPLGYKKRFDEVAPINETGGFLWSCNFCIYKGAFDLVKGFDEDFIYPGMEDIDLRIRLSKFYKSMFVESAFVIHPWRRHISFKKLNIQLIPIYVFYKKHPKFSNTPYQIKIFFKILIYDFIELGSFGFKGISYYFERVLLNFYLIFYHLFKI